MLLLAACSCSARRLHIHIFIDTPSHPAWCAPVLLICSEIVDRAQKELNIEKQIKKIEDTWTVLALLFTPLADSDIMCLQVSSAATLLYLRCSTCCAQQHSLLHIM